MNEGLKSVASLLYINTFYIAHCTSVSKKPCLLGVKQGRGVCGGRLGTLMLRGAEWPVLEWLGPAPTATAHCLLGSHGPETPICEKYV